MYAHEIMKAGSDIIRTETPKKLIQKTVDVYPMLSPQDRETLLIADRQGLKLLNQRNVRP